MKTQEDRSKRPGRSTESRRLWEKPWFPYVFPFALFLLFTGPVQYLPALTPYLYIAKTFIVGALLWFWRREYAADISPGLSPGEWLTALLCGVLALVIWIAPEGHLFQLDQKAAFDPYALGESKAASVFLISVRLIGAALVVPIMEELFWRSFLMRYMINPDFKSVPMGAFSWLSFLGVAVVFGLEHHRVVVGIIVGLLYNLLLVRQKKLKGVIAAHAVTNLGLGVYVLVTGSWMFW
ncbi:MAG: CAAX prenyl protease-related protein [Desulfobacterales bacterium]|nr:CAAX prenyl protease-related protein [Desulfobacterales bacterium]